MFSLASVTRSPGFRLRLPWHRRLPLQRRCLRRACRLCRLLHARGMLSWHQAGVQRRPRRSTGKLVRGSLHLQTMPKPPLSPPLFNPALELA